MSTPLVPPPPVRTRTATEKVTRPLVVLVGAGMLLLVLAVVAALVAGVRRYNVPGSSMWPTIASGQHILSRRLGRAPARGEVIVFDFPENPSQRFVKRVVALEGDRLEIKNGRAHLNGWAIPSCKVGSVTFEGPGEEGEPGELWVEFLGAASYLTFYDARGLGVNEQGPFDAKPGEVLVLGDNRNNSHDSRMWYGGMGGGVPHDLVHGTPFGLNAEAPPVLPESARALQPALDACMQKRPNADPPPR